MTILLLYGLDSVADFRTISQTKWLGFQGKSRFSFLSVLAMLKKIYMQGRDVGHWGFKGDFFSKIRRIRGDMQRGGGQISGYRVQCFVEKRLPSRLSSESDTDNSGWAQLQGLLRLWISIFFFWIFKNASVDNPGPIVHTGSLKSFVLNELSKVPRKAIWAAWQGCVSLEKYILNCIVPGKLAHNTYIYIQILHII